MRTQDEKVDVRATMGLKCLQGQGLEGGAWLLVLSAADEIFTGLRMQGRLLLKSGARAAST